MPSPTSVSSGQRWEGEKAEWEDTPTPPGTGGRRDPPRLSGLKQGGPRGG